jgi:hypothetical protein
LYNYVEALMEKMEHVKEDIVLADHGKVLRYQNSVEEDFLKQHRTKYLLLGRKYSIFEWKHQLTYCIDLAASNNSRNAKQSSAYIRAMDEKSCVLFDAIFELSPWELFSYEEYDGKFIFTKEDQGQ